MSDADSDISDLLDALLDRTRAILGYLWSRGGRRWPEDGLLTYRELGVYEFVATTCRYDDGAKIIAEFVFGLLDPEGSIETEKVCSDVVRFIRLVVDSSANLLSCVLTRYIELTGRDCLVLADQVFPRLPQAAKLNIVRTLELLKKKFGEEEE